MLIAGVAPGPYCVGTPLTIARSPNPFPKLHSQHSSCKLLIWFVPPCARATMWSIVSPTVAPHPTQTGGSFARAFAFMRGPIRPTAQFDLFDIM